MYSIEYIWTKADTVRTSVNIKSVKELTEIPQLKNWPETKNHSNTGMIISGEGDIEKLINKNQLKIAAIDISVDEKYWAVLSPSRTPKGYVKIVEINGRKKSSM